MSVLLVTYDLNREGSNYAATRKKVVEYIKQHAWARLSESSYAIQTSSTPKQVYDALEPHLDNNDDLLVITLTSPYYGQASKAVIDWLQQHMPAASRSYSRF